METSTEPVVQVRDWAIERISELQNSDDVKNALALVSEFDEWLDIPEGVDEINYLCLEDESWGDQEIDIR